MTVGTAPMPLRLIRRFSRLLQHTNDGRNHSAIGGDGARPGGLPGIPAGGVFVSLVLNLLKDGYAVPGWPGNGRTRP